ncbi:uncharacterized protein LOC124911614 [Impatiens glandulifera]|uniref:uncharacterized protein LOC124911614 n=1 Tax=Impatiens glandulifera TaxID=253017 RepID=UPI001FB0CE13|nr:uncharacterized protein LOC124911614 [Impatiens glandulifera]
MAQTKSESDATSIAPSSPLFPKPVVYYVHSPTESNDGDKSHPSITDSPSHRSSSFGYSGSWISGRIHGFSWLGRKKNEKSWHAFNKIDEEHHVDDDELMIWRCQCLIALFGLFSIFFLLCFILWGVSTPLKPQILVESLMVHNFLMGQGSDYSGVPTTMITINSTLNLFIHNPATFFGIQLNIYPLQLFYSEIVVATGHLERYYLPRNSHRLVYVRLQGDKVPLYGARGDLPVSRNNKEIPIKLELDIHSIGYVIGKLVKTRHKLHISCSLSIDPENNIRTIKFRQQSCTKI